MYGVHTPKGWISIVFIIYKHVMQSNIQQTTSLLFIKFGFNKTYGGCNNSDPRKPKTLAWAVFDFFLNIFKNNLSPPVVGSIGINE